MKNEDAIKLINHLYPDELEVNISEINKTSQTIEYTFIYDGDENRSACGLKYYSNWESLLEETDDNETKNETNKPEEDLF